MSDKASRAIKAMGSSEKKKNGSKKHKVHRMEIRHANGGFVVTHHAKPEPGAMSQQEPEEHVVPNVAALQQHVAENMNDGEPAEQQEPQQEGEPDQEQ